VLDHLERLVRASNPPPFNGTLYTADNGWHIGDSNQLVSAANPHELSGHTALLPLHTWHVQAAVRFAPAAPPFAWDPAVLHDCHWTGSKTGYAEVQTKLNANRTKCGTRETDRECVVRLLGGVVAPPGVAFLKQVGRTKVPREDLFNRTACLLAIDGNSFAGILFQGLLSGRAMLRVGGWSTGKRVSSYEWFEPLLVEGVHYIRTDIDHVADAVRTVREMPLAELEAIARRGYNAAKSLFTERSQNCYATLALAELQPRPLPSECAAHFGRHGG
jgi:hypothetical protein